MPIRSCLFQRSVLIGLGGLLLTACAAAQPRYHADWPVLHQKVSRQTELLDGPVPPLKESWSFQTQGRLLYPPIVHEGVVYFGSRDSQIYAVDAATGSELWSEPVDVGGLFSSLSFVNGRLYGGRWNPFYFVYGWDAATGQTLWQKQTGDLVNRPPWVLAQSLPAPSDASASGAPATLLFTHQDPPFGAPLEEQKVVETAWRIAAEPTAQPEKVWERPLPGIPTVAPALDIKQERLFMALDNQQFYALSPATGEVLWQQTLAGEPASAPLVTPAGVYLSTRNGYLYAFDGRSGALKWRYQFVDAALMGDLAMAEQQLLIPGERILYTFDIGSREPGWKYRFPGLITAPVVTHDHVYVGSATRALFVLDRQKGYILGTHPVGGEVLASPVLVGGKVFVACTDGKLYALEEGPRPKQMRPDQVNQMNRPATPRKPTTSRW